MFRLAIVEISDGGLVHKLNQEHPMDDVRIGYVMVVCNGVRRKHIVTHEELWAHHIAANMVQMK